MSIKFTIMFGVSVCTLHGILWLHFFGHWQKIYLYNDAIVGLLRSFLRVTNLTLWENGSLLYVTANHVDLKVVAFGSQKLLPVTRNVDSPNRVQRKHFRVAHLERKF